MDSPSNPHRSWLLITLATALVLLALFLVFQRPMQEWSGAVLDATGGGALALIGLGLLCLDLLLPVPSSLVAMTLAARYPVLLSALVLWLGFSLSAVLGYALGRYGRRRWLRRWIPSGTVSAIGELGPWILLLSRPVPLLAETLVLLAGGAGLSWRQFVVPIALGNALLTLAYLAMAQGVAEFSFAGGILFGATLVPLLGYLGWRAWQRRHVQGLNDGLTVTFDYAIRFTRNAFDPANTLVVDTLCRKSPGQRHRLCVFADEQVLRCRPGLATAIRRYVSAHSDRLALLGDVESIPAGEGGKTMETVVALQRRMLALGLDRHNLVLAIGGGAALDTIGFAAATFHRGIRLVRLPTTVLAQADAGVGVKSGVNAMGEKNLLGSFLPPFAVINDLDLLDSLDVRQRRAGVAETIKVAAIRDASLFAWLEQQGPALLTDKACLARVVEEGARLHWRQIAHGGDPFEFGSARPLDFGHWSAHRLEVATHHDLNHGEAVALGMALDALYAEQVGLCDGDTATRLLNLLEAVGFTLWHPVLGTPRAALRELLEGALEAFRQHLGGELCVTHLTAIGTAIEVDRMDMDEILRAVERLGERAKFTAEAEGTPLCI